MGSEKKLFWGMCKWGRREYAQLWNSLWPRLKTLSTQLPWVDWGNSTINLELYFVLENSKYMHVK